MRSLSLVLQVFAGLLLQAASGIAQAVASQPVSIPLLRPSEMTAADLQTVAKNQTAIARAARVYGYSVDISYSYREIACPVALKHLILAYEATGSDGAVSRFTAVLMRNVQGRQEGYAEVQVIPILKYGMVPFVPAWSSPHAMAVFNQSVVGVASDRQPLSYSPSDGPLLTPGLCYLAMVGESPAILRTPSFDPATFRAPVPTLKFLEKNRLREVVSVPGDIGSYTVWGLTFSRTGALMAVQREIRAVDAEPPILTAAPVVEPLPNAAPPVFSNYAAMVSPVTNSAGPVANRSTRTPVSESIAPAAVIPSPRRRFIPEPPTPPSRIIPDPLGYPQP